MKRPVCIDTPGKIGFVGEQKKAFDQMQATFNAMTPDQLKIWDQVVDGGHANMLRDICELAASQYNLAGFNTGLGVVVGVGEENTNRLIKQAKKAADLVKELAEFKGPPSAARLIKTRIKLSLKTLEKQANSKFQTLAGSRQRFNVSSFTRHALKKAKSNRWIPLMSREAYKKLPDLLDKLDFLRNSDFNRHLTMTVFQDQV